MSTGKRAALVLSVYMVTYIYIYVYVPHQLSFFLSIPASVCFVFCDVNLPEFLVSTLSLAQVSVVC
jgi:hypothetical protein